MNKLKTFLRTYLRTLTDYTYYNDIVQAKPTFSLKYFLVFFLILAIINAVEYNYNFKPQLQQSAQDAIHDITTNYPSNLTLNLTNNQLFVDGVTEPFHVPFPDSLTDPATTNYFDYLLTIDTLRDFPQTKSLITLSRTDLFVRRPDGRKESISYADMEIGQDIFIDKNSIQLMTSALQSTLDTLIRYSPFAVFAAGILIAPVITIFTLLLFNLFLWLLANLLNKNLSYSKTFQIGLHLATFAETVVLAQTLLFPNLNYLHLYSLAFFGAALIAIVPLKPTRTK